MPASAAAVVVVVAADHLDDALGDAPALEEHRAGGRVVERELAALGAHALLGRAGLAEHLAGVRRRGGGEDDLADVVQQRGERDLGRRLVLEHRARCRRAARWTATACRRKRSGGTRLPATAWKKS